MSEVDQLTDKLQSLEKRIKSNPNDVLSSEHAKLKQQGRISELEAEVHKLTRQVVDHEEGAKLFNREREALENANSKIKDNLNKLIADHEVLKTKSLELLKRTTHVENENDSLRKEKSQLVDNILDLQKGHQDELSALRSTLESITEKLYVVELDTDNKQTFSELEIRHAEDKKAWTDKNRILQETCEQLQKDCQAMEEKIDEQHQVITTYQKLENTFKEEQRKLRNLEKEFDLLSESHANLESEKNDAHKQIKHLERELGHSKEDNNKARLEIQELQDHKTSLHRANNGLDSQIQELEKATIDLKERLKQAEQQNRSHERTITQYTIFIRFKADSIRSNDILKLSKDEINSLQDSLAEKRKELDLLEKDRSFLKKKVERLEDQLFQKEKKFLREEAEKEFDSEERVRRLVQENETLKEELISKLPVTFSSRKSKLQTLQRHRILQGRLMHSRRFRKAQSRERETQRRLQESRDELAQRKTVAPQGNRCPGS